MHGNNINIYVPQMLHKSKNKLFWNPFLQHVKYLENRNKKVKTYLLSKCIEAGIKRMYLEL